MADALKDEQKNVVYDALDKVRETTLASTLCKAWKHAQCKGLHCTATYHAMCYVSNYYECSAMLYAN